jgi:hypothetical protein
MSEHEWVTLLDVNDRIEAEIIKEALEAQGIPAQIFQEGIAHFAYPVTVGPLANVEICVPADRSEEAQAWLADYRSGQLESDAPEENDNPQDAEPDENSAESEEDAG